MKDFTISGNKINRELLSLLVCFIIAFLLNVLAIIIYKTNFSEIVSSLHYVLMFSLVLYVLWSIVRLLFVSIKYLILDKKKK